MRVGLPALLITLFSATLALAQATDIEMRHSEMHLHDQMHSASAQMEHVKEQDTREAVQFPATMREHTLANMRDHLLALQQVQEALAAEDFDKAADIAEQRLGMSSLTLHGAHDVAPFMPEGMKVIGTSMHRNASRFAVAAKDAGVTGNMKTPLAELSNVTAQCVACHAGYRMK